MWLAQPFIENFVRKIKKRDDFTGHNFQNTKPVPSRPANKPDGTGRPAILSRPVLNPGNLCTHEKNMCVTCVRYLKIEVENTCAVCVVCGARFHSENYPLDIFLSGISNFCPTCLPTWEVGPG